MKLYHKEKGEGVHENVHQDFLVWQPYELQALLRLCLELKLSLSYLSKKGVSVKRVHSARLILRRWQIVNEVVTGVGWQNKTYQQTQKKVLRFRKTLGKLRDWQTLLSLGKIFRLPKRLIKQWQQAEKQSLKKAEQVLLSGALEKEVNKLIKVIKSELSGNISANHLNHQIDHLDRQTQHYQTITLAPDNSLANAHLEAVLRRIESYTYQAELNAYSPQQLHGLRLCIKKWRYFLCEFYGVTCLQLVSCQQLLGKIHDLDCLFNVLEKGGQLSLLDNNLRRQIYALHERLLQEFGHARKYLPYGFRPESVGNPTTFTIDMPCN